MKLGKHYGEGIIKEHSKRLTSEIGIKYSIRVLYKMLKFYNFMDTEKLPTVSAKLTWSHYDELLKLNDDDKITYYIMITEQQNLSVRQLREKIKNNEYERLDDNAKVKLINNIDYVISDFIKNTANKEIISEKVLHRLILEDLDSFLKELGNSFSYIASEYKIKIGASYNYIDLLLYNIEFNCYVVVELKVTELRKEYIGQIEIYMNYIDKNLRKVMQDKTIGIVICKKGNKFIMEYCSDKRILAKEYKLV